MSSFEKLLARKLEDPAIRQGYEDAERRRRLVAELVEARKSQGLTQTDVATRMGVGQSTVAGFESGESDPRTGTLQRYARAVNRRLDVFVTTPADCRFAELPVEHGQVAYAAKWRKDTAAVAGTASEPGRSSRTDFALAG